ncbi:MAG: manganese efflux pump [Solobacterium sp.]|nr:manganese efflux pump [Solobacterium sp.]
MQVLHVLMVFLGLTFSGFVVIMNKGATLDHLTAGKAAVYALICTAVNCLALLAGYGISVVCRGLLSTKAEIIFAYLLLFFIGIFLTVRAYHTRNIEEKVDRSFDNKQCFVLAMRFSYGIVLVGAGCFMLGIDFPIALLIVAVLTLINVFAALYVGYYFGPGFSRTVGMSGGMLMVVFTVIRFAEYLSNRG